MPRIETDERLELVIPSKTEGHFIPWARAAAATLES